MFAKMLNSKTCILPPLDQPIVGGGGQHLLETFDQTIIKNKTFLEFIFGEGLFYTKNVKSKIFKDTEFQGLLSSKVALH